MMPKPSPCWPYGISVRTIITERRHYPFVSAWRIGLLFVYPKDEQVSLTPAQKVALGKIIEPWRSSWMPKILPACAISAPRYGSRYDLIVSPRETLATSKRVGGGISELRID